MPVTEKSNTHTVYKSDWKGDSKFCVNYDKRYTNIYSHPASGKVNKPSMLPPKPLFGYEQPWNGWCPPCTNNKGCKNLPCQTFNIKTGNIYEGIETSCDKWISMACDEAKYSAQHGGGPFGAVIVRVDNDTGEALEYWKSHNHVELWSDPTAHAEVTTIRIACQDLSKRWNTSVFDLGNIVNPHTKNKSHCVIFSSAEPCPMCYAAINWSRIPVLVFAATRFDSATQGVDFSDELIYNDLSRPYKERQNIKVYQASCPNSLDAFNLWKRMQKLPY